MWNGQLNEAQIVWTEKEKQISDVLTKAEAPQKLSLEILESSQMLDL